MMTRKSSAEHHYDYHRSNNLMN